MDKTAVGQNGLELKSEGALTQEGGQRAVSADEDNMDMGLNVAGATDTGRGSPRHVGGTQNQAFTHSPEDWARVDT